MHPDGHALLEDAGRRDVAEVGARELPLLTEERPAEPATGIPHHRPRTPGGRVSAREEAR